MLCGSPNALFSERLSSKRSNACRRELSIRHASPLTFSFLRPAAGALEDFQVHVEPVEVVAQEDPLVVAVAPRRVRDVGRRRARSRRRRSPAGGSRSTSSSRRTSAPDRTESPGYRASTTSFQQLGHGARVRARGGRPARSHADDAHDRYAASASIGSRKVLGSTPGGVETIATCRRTPSRLRGRHVRRRPVAAAARERPHSDRAASPAPRDRPAGDRDGEGDP